MTANPTKTHVQNNLCTRTNFKCTKLLLKIAKNLLPEKCKENRSTKELWFKSQICLDCEPYGKNQHKKKQSSVPKQSSLGN